MALDFKKELKGLYGARQTPAIVDVPRARYLAVRGQGDPNDPSGEYPRAIEQLYGVAYTIKMSKKGSWQPEGYFDFVVPPLEGLWWQEGVRGIDYAHKEGFRFVALLRAPDFVTPEVLEWAREEATRKKRADFSGVELLELDEGLCAQVLHLGPYDDEPETVERLHEFAAREGYEPDFSDERRHHEIYLGDPRKTAPEKLKTIVRHPVRKA